MFFLLDALTGTVGLAFAPAFFGVGAISLGLIGVGGTGRMVGEGRVSAALAFRTFPAASYGISRLVRRVASVPSKPLLVGLLLRSLTVSAFIFVGAPV